MTTLQTIEKRLGANKQYIQQNYHVVSIGIFGSFISGENTKKSDLDCLVQFKSGYKDFFNYMRLKFYLEELLGQEVDLVMKDALKPRLKENILKQVQYV